MAEEPQDFILDLATLHGVERPLIVKTRDGNRYELLRREALGPSQLALIDKVLRRIAEMEKEGQDGEELTEAQDKRIRGMVHDMIRVLSSELGAMGMCYADELSIVGWYSRQGQPLETATRADAAQPKNAESASV